MVLSYGSRLICLVLFSAGLMQLMLALLLRLSAYLLRHRLAGLRPRWQERACFAELIASHGTAFVLVLAVLVPQYIRSEANLSKERVGAVCFAAALLVAVRYAYALARAVGLICRSRLDGETAIAGRVRGIPVRLTRCEYPLLAVSGFFAPEIVISRRLLDSATLSPEALEIALAHERAHLRQFDNLKLLLLASLELPFRSVSAVRRWRRVAEMAADRDAAAGSRPRAILLAETLLAAARSGSYPAQAALALGLLPHEEDLEERVYHLIGGNRASAPVKPFNRVDATLLLFGAASLLLLLASTPLHDCAECLLHLG